MLRSVHFSQIVLQYLHNAVGMTASDWPVSRVVKKSQPIHLNVASLLSFTEIAISRLILWLKEKEIIMQWSALQSLPELRRSFKMCGNSNALNVAKITWLIGE